MNIDPYAKVSDLSVGEMQRVEIIKTLYRGAQILILDEPTAVLTPQETGELFKMIKGLTQNGFTVLFISHKLNEVKEISDRVTVLRLGRVMGTHSTKDCTISDLARMMVGREVKFTVDRKEQETGKTVLSLHTVSLSRKGGGRNILDDISFDVHAGEIVGIAGVDGNGQAELVECLTGITKATAGEAMYCGKDILGCGTREIMSSGVSHIPQDRQKTGLVMPMPLTENFILQDYYTERFGKHGFLDWKSVDGYSDRLISAFSIKTPGRTELVQNLSGGNQQKVVVAREINRSPKLIIAMHPTRGLDVGAIEYIHSKLIEQRDSGAAILLVSTEMEEILKMSDRIVGMYEGRVMGIVRPCDTTSEKMGLMMGGTEITEIS
jgi:simple sugar transport system ATP-binding protein